MSEYLENFKWDWDAFKDELEDSLDEGKLIDSSWERVAAMEEEGEEAAGSESKLDIWESSVLFSVLGAIFIDSKDK